MTRKPKRKNGGEQELGAAQHAADSVIALFSQLLQFGYRDNKKAIDGMQHAFLEREITIRARLEFDRDGVTSFQFFSVRPGEPARPMFDAVPKHVLDS